MTLEQGKPIVIEVAEPRLLVFCLADVAGDFVRLAQVHIDVEARLLQLENLVLGLAHDVRDAVARLDVRCAIRQQHVLGRDKDRRLSPKAGVVVHLLECRAGGRQAPEHALMFWPELHHHLGELVVHVVLDAYGRFLLAWSLLAQNLGAHRAGRREGLGDCF